jgi:cytochrome c-type biogenesis protein CcmH
MTLSQFSPVVVGARISRSGNAIAQPGDIEGGSGEVVPGETGTVSIDLNRVVE